MDTAFVVTSVFHNTFFYWNMGSIKPCDTIFQNQINWFNILGCNKGCLKPILRNYTHSFLRDTVIQRLDLSLKFPKIKTGIVPHISLKSQVISLFDISKNVDSELN